MATEEKKDTEERSEESIKIERLERKYDFLRSEFDRQEERRREAAKVITIFLTGVCYGLVLVWIFNL